MHKPRTATTANCAKFTEESNKKLKSDLNLKATIYNYVCRPKRNAY